MSYRVEISVSGRAKCAATKCNKEGIKIVKGEIRQGIVVVTPDFQSMKWRHWGCVTPTVLRNWWQTAESNLDLVDGYDELPEEAQQKVKQALEQGHVEDKDWNGDIECNRFDPKDPNQGMFLKGAKLKAKQAAEAEENEEDVKESKPVKKTAKKRGRAAEDDEDEKPAKKTKAKKAAAADEDEAEQPPAKKTKAKKKSANVDDAEEESEAKSKASTSKAKKPAKKSKAVKAEPEDDAEPSDEAEQQEKAPTRKTTKSRAKKSAVKEEPGPETGSTVKTEDDADGVDDDPPKPKFAGKRKKAAKK